MKADRPPRHWIPASAVVMGVVILLTSINTYSGLVVDDYYRKGKQINRVIARDRLAWELGLAAELRLTPGGGIEILKRQGFAALPEDSIDLDLVHATIPGRDRSLRFAANAGDRLVAAIDELGEGRWNVYLHTADWRLTGSLQRPQQDRVLLTPNYRGANP